MAYALLSRGKVALYKLAHEAGSEKRSNDHGGMYSYIRGNGIQGLVQQGRLLLIIINKMKQCI